MIVYPALVEALDGRDVDEVADAAGVRRENLRAVLDGGWPTSPGFELRVARVLGASPFELFHAWSRLPDGELVDLEPTLLAAPSRYVTDPATLRVIDRRAA